MTQGALQPGVSAVTASERELGKEPWDRLIENGTIVTASLVAKSTNQLALSDARGSADGQIESKEKTMKSLSSDAVAKAIGPYSHAMKANGFLFTAGQMPVTAEGKIEASDIEGQTRQIFKNLRALLSEEGLTTEAVIKSTVFVQDFAEYPMLNSVYAEEFAGHKPARTTVQVAALPLGAKVEIEFVAELAT